ncbi:unnamed protein product [Ilex paraguariensis]|uniref:Uncharacterized protein n=1 Tax=Ilex paraguariensis TaxID=185542 RepID=A0ABC8UL47_9AQUA
MKGLLGLSRMVGTSKKNKGKKKSSWTVKFWSPSEGVLPAKDNYGYTTTRTFLEYGRRKQ